MECRKWKTHNNVLWAQKSCKQNLAEIPFLVSYIKDGRYTWRWSFDLIKLFRGNHYMEHEQGYYRIKIPNHLRRCYKFIRSYHFLKSQAEYHKFWGWKLRHSGKNLNIWIFGRIFSHRFYKPKISNSWILRGSQG